MAKVVTPPDISLHYNNDKFSHLIKIEIVDGDKRVESE